VFLFDLTTRKRKALNQVNKIMNFNFRAVQANMNQGNDDEVYCSEMRS